MGMGTEVGLIEGCNHGAGGDDVVDGAEGFFGEGDFEGTEIVVELFEGTRPDDGAGNAGLIHAPAQRKLGEAAIKGFGDGIELVDDF